MLYALPHPLLQVTDALGKATVHGNYYTSFDNGQMSAQQLTVPGSSGAVALTYDANDQRATQTAPNGIISTYGYDAQDRLVDLAHNNPDNTLIAHPGYRFDNADNVLQTLNPDGSATAFAYDQIHQIKRETRNGASAYDFAYAYDHDRNRVSKQKFKPGPQRRTIGDSSTLVVVGDDEYIYDANGDLVNVNGYQNVPKFGDPYTATTYGHDTRGNLKPLSSTGTFSGVELIKYNSDNFPEEIDSTGGHSSILYNGDLQMLSRNGRPLVIDGLEPLASPLTEGDIAFLAMMSDHSTDTNTLGSFTTYLGNGAGDNIANGAVYDSFGNLISGPDGGYQAGNGVNTGAGGAAYYQGADVSDPQIGRSATKSPADDDEGSPAHDHDHDRMYQSGPHPGVEGVHKFVGYLGDVADAAASFWEPYNDYKLESGKDMFGRPISGLDRALCALPFGAKLAEGLRGSKVMCWIFEHGCFVAGTPVAMADGSFKPIEQVKAGDFVLSRDPAQLGVSRIEGKQVLQTSVRNNIHTLSLTFEDGETIETTGEHPFYVEGEGFTPAGRLAIGNAIVTRAGPVTRLVRVVWNAAPKTVYNFTVAGDHTYFVGRNSGGVWVHNIPCRELLTPAELEELTRIRENNGGWHPRPEEELNPRTIQGTQEARRAVRQRGHHRIPIAFGGDPNPAEGLVPTGETRRLKNPIHTEATNFWNRVLRRLRGQ